MSNENNVAELNQPQNTFTLTDNQTGKSYELPGLDGTIGPRVIDIRKLYSQAGVFTYDPGYTSTASCSSEITYIDGEQGILMHRGYPIEQLAEHSSYMEVCHLLLYGELPSPEQKEEFEDIITHHTMLHEQLIRLYQGFRRGSHPMAIMVGVVGALSAFYHDSTDISDPEHRAIAAHRLISKMPTIAAHAFKYSIGQPFIPPRNKLTYPENLLRMIFAVPAEKYEISPVLSKAIDKILILHADHEQNASTSTVRLAGSSAANPFACIASGIASLWGPAHGGANEAVLKMLDKIGDKSRIPEYIDKAHDPKDDFRLMGFGHRVYKNFDPRAKVMRETCHAVLNELGVDDPLLELAVELEQLALKDSYFIDKKLYPNVDFYSGIMLKAMGFPTNMFTPMFAIGRTVGWVAHWKEMLGEEEHKIGRPRQLYTGQPQRDYTEVDVRQHSESKINWSWLWGGSRGNGAA